MYLLNALNSSPILPEVESAGNIVSFLCTKRYAFLDPGIPSFRLSRYSVGKLTIQGSVTRDVLLVYLPGTNGFSPGIKHRLGPLTA